jgi:2,3-bisphosphoglycerate-independent phosphoglycerate mutase
MPATPKPVLLCVLDGWGCRSDADHNAIKAAKTPNFDKLWATYPHGRINASELHVGLPEGQMGNSEVGHMNIGSGRVVMQELPRINQAVKGGALAQNPALLDFIAKLKSSGGACHLMGLVSPGGVHSHQDHIAALANIVAAAGVKVWIHAFLDGRDTPPKSAVEYLEHFEKSLATRNPQLATISGRYYAMDRDKRWERVKLAFDAITVAYGHHAKDWREAVRQSYEAGKTDEFVIPAALSGYKGMQPGDGVLMANFRADRAREILSALLDPAFEGFPREKTIPFAAALGMVEYSTTHAQFMQALFPPEALTQILGEVVADAGLKQLRIAETEKYPHVTFFFNGGKEELFPGEERILVPSPKVATYDLQPEMSAYEVTDKLVAAIASGAFDLIVANYANTDMVGHTGDLEAARKAVEAVDTCLGRVWDALEKAGGALILSADHGNAEQMHDHDTQQPHTAHTLNLVPVIVAAAGLEGQSLNRGEGKLADLAPTALALLGLKQPKEMTGKSLL